ncbi:hypothetical protein AGMMS49938_19130 [Fibrobacterales bacterium]|nr:hypothetical protein AGMMS49938_19130 [Fibrobacterales bacterium]
MRKSQIDELGEKFLFVGEPLQLSGKLKINFKAKPSSNMLLIGQNEQKAKTMFVFSALSLAIQEHSHQSIYIIDYAPSEDAYEKDILAEFAKNLKTCIKYVTHEDAGDILEELDNDLRERKKGNYSGGNKYLLLFGLQRARNLRDNDIYQSGSGNGEGLDLGISQGSSGTLYDKFLNILKNGAINGIHSIIWIDQFKTFNAHYPRTLSNFDLRIAFTMADEDSLLFIEEPHGSQISENNAIFSYNGNQKIRPYKKPELNYLETICNRLNNV